MYYSSQDIDLQELKAFHPRLKRHELPSWIPPLVEDQHAICRSMIFQVFKNVMDKPLMVLHELGS